MQAFPFPPGLTTYWPSTLTFGPDGRFLVMAAWAYQVLDTAAGRWAEPFPGSMERNVQFVLGGRSVAYLDAAHLGVANLDTRKARRHKLQQAGGYGLVAAPDGKTLFVLVNPIDGRKGSSVWRFNAATLKRQGEEFASQKPGAFEMVGSADGRRLATGRTGLDQAIRVWDTTNPKRRAVTITPKTSPGQYALSADGGHLATTGSRGVTLWNTATGREVWASGKHRRAVTFSSFSPTRPLLATGDNAGNVFLWDFAGRVLARYDFGLGHVSGLAFAPDGLRCAAVGTRQVVIWDIDA
jgi:hypothetical protein